MPKNSKIITFLLGTIPFWVMFFFYNYPIVVIGIFLLFLASLWALWYFKKIKVYGLNQLFNITLYFGLIYEMIWGNFHRDSYGNNFYYFGVNFFLLACIIAMITIYVKSPYKGARPKGKAFIIFLVVTLAWSFFILFGATFYALNYTDSWDFSYPFFAIAILPMMYPLEEIRKREN
jgi:hypothetical protein